MDVGQQNISWHRPKTDDRYVEAVTFLPHTNASELKMRLTKIEERLKFRTRYRYIETGGRTISSHL